MSRVLHSASSGGGFVRTDPLVVSRVRLAPWVVPAALVAVVVLAVRVVIALTPVLSETYYDEALSGLMSLAILRGERPVFYWGQPYLGAIDTYLAAAAFQLFGVSTLVLRLGSAWLSVFWAWAIWRVARRVAGPGWGLWAGLFVSVPPIFLTYMQLSSHGESVALTFGALTLGAGARLMDPAARSKRDPWAWAGLGLAGGLGWYASPMVGMLLLATAAALVVARPRVLRTLGPYMALTLFFVGSLPFWVWNARHEWATFLHLATWGGPLPRLPARIVIVTATLLASLRDHFWDGRAVRLPAWTGSAYWLVVAGVYVPAVLVAGLSTAAWGRRLWRRERPWREPLDLVVLTFWLTVAAHLLTWFGTSGVLRYSMTFYTTLPVLCAVALARLAATGRCGVIAAAGLAVALLGHNLLAHGLFVRDAAAAPYRPVDRAIGGLRALGVRACYADSRIAQVLAFESAERIVCADYEGLRNFAFLQAVDRVEDARTVAIVTHRVLKTPDPEVAAASLRLAGAGFQREEIGDYVIFHHFTAPEPMRPIPPDGWTGRASSESDRASAAFDRRVWTRWMVPNRRGEWLEVDLGGSHRVTGVTLEPGPWLGAAPRGLRVEVSDDGRAWETVARVEDLWPGVHWWRGHPRVDDSGRVTVRIAPRLARRVRLVAEGSADNPASRWGIAELFVYEAAAASWSPPPAATAALEEAARELDRWMDDPGGPHPKRAPVTYEHRRGRVRWSAAFASANRALALAPEWEEAHRLYAGALSRSGWSDTPDAALERARQDGAWPEVVRWAEQADQMSERVWRKGRLAAWAEALDRLGRGDEAAAVRARPAPGPMRPVQIRFGDALELTGLDVPDRVRPSDVVTVRYFWRLARPLAGDYWVFLHLDGLAGADNQDRPVGVPGFGTSRWSRGEEVRQGLTFRVPAGTRPGSYPLRLGVWWPERRTYLPIGATPLPRKRQAVVIGALTVAP